MEGVTGRWPEDTVRVLTADALAPLRVRCPHLWLLQGTCTPPPLEAEGEPECLCWLDTVQSREQCWEVDPLETTEALRPICCGSLQEPEGGLGTPDSGLGDIKIIAL